MTRSRTTLVSVALGSVTLGAALSVASAMPAMAFGTYNSPTIMGQQAEHERITRVLQAEGIGPKTMDLIAGTSGKLGAVGAPDDAIDSSLIPGKGLGPGEKHCDNADYLDVSGYPQSLDTARGQIATCFRYYEQLLDRAVSAAGKLVDEKGTINAAEAAAPSCSFPFSMGKSDKTAKCEVINRLGRALHLAEDFWSHSNWADAPDPTKPISIQNPPGLGRSDIPAGLRYPGGGGAEVPDGLISGCDDSVPVLGSLECKGRVTHSMLAKDNGSINPGSCSSASPTNKYPRGQVTSPNGQQNFTLAVCGAMSQAQQTWRDLTEAIVATYGNERGDVIVAVLSNDSLPAGAALSNEATESASPSESPSSTESASETSSPSASASESAVEIDATSESPGAEATPADEASSDIERQAAAAAPAANVVDAPASGSSTPMFLLAVAVGMGVVAAGWYVISRRRSAGEGVTKG
ncbi:MAG TPA: hypothetical protein DCQ36_02555 [Actinobacteria bacterium]|jgi:hypothetical protein|nr:hypothetical protein [Actinomycetota bacterium]